MPKYPAWAIAAAIIVFENKDMDYNEITSKVLSSGLTKLADTGNTPEKTLRVEMIDRHPEFFRRSEKKAGYYNVKYDNLGLLKNLDVTSSIDAITEKNLAEYNKLIREIITHQNIRDKNIKDKVLRLEKDLHRISEIFLK